METPNIITTGFNSAPVKWYVTLKSHEVLLQAHLLIHENPLQFFLLKS